MGIPADRETKLARRAAHAAFDEVRNVLQLSKTDTYKWLQSVMGMASDQCHMGKFDKMTCERVVNVCAKAVNAVGGDPFARRNREH
jgi:hypothetical protein